MGSRAKSYRCCWGERVRAVVAGEAGFRGTDAIKRGMQAGPLAGWQKNQP
jgi:hypothetical protein